MDTNAMIITSTAIVATGRASRYGKQLVSHLGRRSIGTWDETLATGTLDIGDNEAHVAITCTPDTLNIRLLTDDSKIATFENIVTRHLERFSARDPLAVHWNRSDR
jgi:hypothetical protein